MARIKYAQVMPTVNALNRSKIIQVFEDPVRAMAHFGTFCVL